MIDLHVHSTMSAGRNCETGKREGTVCFCPDRPRHDFRQYGGKNRQHGL